MVSRSTSAGCSPQARQFSACRIRTAERLEQGEGAAETVVVPLCRGLVCQWMALYELGVAVPLTR